MSNGMSTPKPALHIVEPTLNSDVGHCMSLVRALSQAAVQADCTDITVWGGRDATNFSLPEPTKLQPHFVRRWRRFQALALYRRLLRQPGHVLVSTAGSADLVSLDWAARSTGMRRIPLNKVALFVHWLNIKPGKIKLFSAIARRQPHLKILAPTASVVDFFRQCGFDAHMAPYPIESGGTHVDQVAAPPAFSHLLVPGGARMDKGFDHIVDLVEALAASGKPWPIVIQTSMEHGHDRDPALAAAMARLKALRHGPLRILDGTLDQVAYKALFQGAIVIQPYNAENFRDRVSGVTLDALRVGSPVVVTEGTWMAALVSKHGAGIATPDLSPAGLMHAIDTILAAHTAFAERAIKAAAAVQAQHSARGLIDVVIARDPSKP